MAERVYYYATNLEPTYVREIITDDQYIVEFLAEVNMSWAIFFTSSDPVETVHEPFIINKIA
jgi:hypothetical protein